MKVTAAETHFQHKHLEYRHTRQHESLLAGHSAEGERLNSETMVEGVSMAQTLQHRDFRMSIRELSAVAKDQGGDLELNSPNETEPSLFFPPPPQRINTDSTYQVSFDESVSQQVRIMKMMIEIITGKDIDTADETPSAEIQLKEASSQAQSSNTLSQTTNSTPSVNTTQESTFGLRYHFKEISEDYEYSEFSGHAQITLDDGREIQVSLQQIQERYFQHSEEVLIEVGTAAIDPLIISAPNTSLSFTDDKFNFDLDNDGQTDALNSLSQGNYYLAFDKNNDGVINNGSELFGPETGNGFLELSVYDEDNNGFIDEGDSIFSQLQLMSGNGQNLYSITHLDIGAISLESIATPYTFKNQDNEIIAQSRASSYYLTEKGDIGQIQHIDYWL